MKEKHGPSSTTAALDSEEIPQEMDIISYKVRSNSIHLNPSFAPGLQQKRSLPPTPGSEGGSRRTLENSPHFPSSSRIILHLPELSKNLSKFSQQDKEESKLASEENHPAVIFVNMEFQDITKTRSTNESDLKDIARESPQDVDQLRKKLMSTT